MLILLFQLQGATVSMVDQEYVVRNYTVEDGLPVNSVNGIVQDDNGYLYFSTLDGLVRFDGYHFVTFNSANSSGFNNDRISKILKTESGDIWLLNTGGEVVQFNGVTFRTFNRTSGINGEALQIAESSYYGLLVAGSNGVAIFDENEEMFRPLDDSLLNTESSLLATGKDSSIVVVNNYGIVYWKNSASRLLVESKKIPGFEKGLNNIVDIDPEAYWLTGDFGAVRISKKTGETLFTYYSENTIWDILRAGPSTYILTGAGGLTELNINTGIQKEYAVKGQFSDSKYSNKLSPQEEKIITFVKKKNVHRSIQIRTKNIYLVFLDDEESFWIASVNRGLYQIRKSSFKNINFAAGRVLENVYSIFESRDGSIWAASLVGGVFQIGKSKERNWRQENSNLDGNEARMVFQDTDGTIYCSLWDGEVWKFKEGDWQRIDELIEIMGTKFTAEAMFRDSNGRLIIGTRSKTVIMENGNYRILENGPEGVRVIAENKSEYLFMGTHSSGLYILKRNEVIHKITAETGLSSNLIRDIYIQSADTVWIVTENRGLNRLVLKDGIPGSIEVVSSRDGLLTNSLHKIIEDPFGFLWISSNSGIMRVNKKALNNYADGRSTSLPIIAFNEKNGMMNREANGGTQSAGLLSSDRKLWFPNQDGITVIDPANFESDFQLTKIKPIVEWITTPDTSINPNGSHKIIIPKGVRNLTFKLTAPNFAYPSRVHLKYRLEGVNVQWQMTNIGHEATYTNLQPGTYVFDVAAERIGGSTAQSSMLLIIPHFFYETQWFLLLIGFVTILAMFAGYKYRIGLLQKREKKLEQMVNEQTKELQKAAEQKSRFFSGITHELKTPLSLIIGPIDDLMSDEEFRFATKLRGKLKIMHRNSHRLKNLVDQILDVTKLNAEAVKLVLQPFDIFLLSKQIIGQFHSLLDQRNLHIEFKSEGDTSGIYVDKEAWERIIINLISNAIKYSPEEGRIILSVKEFEDEIEVRVKDFGIGIRAEDQDKVFDYLFQAEGNDAASGTGIGLFLVKVLTERMGGTVALESVQGEGAEFIIRLRKGYVHFHNADEIRHKSENISLFDTKALSSNTKENTIIYDTEAEESVLIVEDNEDFKSYLQSILSKKYRVYTAGNGHEAFEMLGKVIPDIIISDIMMPAMNGLDMVNKLREAEKFKHLPVIFLSAKDREADMQKGLSTGADIYLTKPINSQMLLTQVIAVLRRERILRTKDLHEEAQPVSELEARVREIVYRQLANSNLNVSTLTDALYLGRTKLYEEWKKVSDINLNSYIKRMKFEEAMILIKEQKFTIKEAARAVGFNDPNYFSTSFKNEFGYSPSKLMSEGRTGK